MSARDQSRAFVAGPLKSRAYLGAYLWVVAGLYRKLWEYQTNSSQWADTPSANAAQQMLIVSPLHCVLGLIASRAPSHLVSLCSSVDDLADLPPWSSESHLRLCFHDITETPKALWLPTAACSRPCSTLRGRGTGRVPC